MHEVATSYKNVTDDTKIKLAKGAIHILTRVFPLLFEDKELLMRSMWREQALFNNQVNALKMMEAISLLFFKPGFTVLEVPQELELQYFGKFSIPYLFSFRYRRVACVEVRH